MKYVQLPISSAPGHACAYDVMPGVFQNVGYGGLIPMVCGGLEQEFSPDAWPPWCIASWCMGCVCFTCMVYRFMMMHQICDAVAMVMGT